jgi:hypothetical protein
MHKSARASSIPADLFENGVSSANPLMVNQFVTLLLVWLIKLDLLN